VQVNVFGKGVWNAQGQTIAPFLNRSIHMETPYCIYNEYTQF
jgi:hypothetical protein